MQYIRRRYNAYVLPFRLANYYIMEIRYSLIPSRPKATHNEDERDVVLTYLKQKRKRFG